jgi:hypothetical protein
LRKRNDIAFHFIAKKDSVTRSQLTREVCYRAWYDISSVDIPIYWQHGPPT